ncbi:hypothetical protein QTP88_022305 [Uroleucon formosanum]
MGDRRQWTATTGYRVFAHSSSKHRLRYIHKYDVSFWKFHICILFRSCRCHTLFLKLLIDRYLFYLCYLRAKYALGTKIIGHIGLLRRQRKNLRINARGKCLKEKKRDYNRASGTLFAAEHPYSLQPGGSAPKRNTIGSTY